MSERDGGFAAQKRSIDLMWGGAGRPSRGPKPGLSVERITRAAIDLADADGLSAVSLQRVAAEFGFTTTSLYRYVPGKSELIDLMVDAAAGDPPRLDEIPGGWRPKLEEWARQNWMVFHRHPWILAATSSLRLMGPNQLGWMNAALGAMAGTGLSPRDLHDAFLLVNGHARNLAQQTTGPATSADVKRWGDTTAEVLRLHGGSYPELMAVIAGGGFDPEGSDSFEFGLSRILDGLQTLIAERTGERPRGAGARRGGGNPPRDLST